LVADLLSTAALAVVSTRPAVAAPARSFGIVEIRPGHRLSLRLRPGGPAFAVSEAADAYGERTIFAVTHTTGRWAAVTSYLLPNGRRAWVRLDGRAVRTRATTWRIVADLSNRTLTAYHGRRVALRAPVAIGRPGTETPTGRFAITDKLDGRRYGAAYGCCILALAGQQPKVVVGGVVGHMAIHGTDDPAGIGHPDSLGCLHATDPVLRRLWRLVPVGTPVFIRA
jgi:lipoprotein-anchoring transpeptidase ErfK/SrfK